MSATNIPLIILVIFSSSETLQDALKLLLLSLWSVFFRVLERVFVSLCHVVLITFVLSHSFSHTHSLMLYPALSIMYYYGGVFFHMHYPIFSIIYFLPCFFLVCHVLSCSFFQVIFFYFLFFVGFFWFVCFCCCVFCCCCLLFFLITFCTFYTFLSFFIFYSFFSFIFLCCFLILFRLADSVTTLVRDRWPDLSSHLRIFTWRTGVGRKEEQAG